MVERLLSRTRLGIFLFLLALAAFARADIDFPELTGRVVDRANILSSQQRQQLASRLQAFEQANGNQLVVVTLASLQGYTIEEYGYQLGRTWGIGQQESDNGLLLIVAPSERKVRIEVGYGLEGEVTDALAANIIQTRILPRFRQGDYPGGIDAGVAALMEVFGGEYQMQPVKQNEQKSSPLLLPLIIFVIFVILSGFGGGGGFGGRRRGAWIYGGGFGGGRGGGFGGGGFGGGGFSGGGGGFGGGGASGSW